MNKVELKKQLTEMGIKIVEGNYVKKSDLFKVMAENEKPTAVAYCKDCKYFDNGYCTIIEIEDEKYTHNNNLMAGIVVWVSDDSGLDVKLRVSPVFGCNLFKK